METMQPAWAMALEANFGSVAAWREDFVRRARQGPVALLFVAARGTLVNGDGREGEALLAFDGGVDADADAFVAAIDWSSVYAKYQAAVHAASEPFALAADELPGRRVFDVRRAGAFVQATQMLPGAGWRDPAEVGHWAAELPSGEPVAVYCVYGHEVGRATALRLRAAGIDAGFIAGGIDGWKADGRPLIDKPAAGRPLIDKPRS